jgi:transcriptional regulator with GAF, ATPase, and Fis domain
MNKDKNVSTLNVYPQSLALSLAAVFEQDFSIDWLQELTRTKASSVLSILEQAMQVGILTRKKPGVYTFRSNELRHKWLNRLSQENRELYHRKAAAILINELPDDDSKAMDVAQHFLFLRSPVNAEECKWLIRAGEIYATSFQAEKALACFSAALKGLSSEKGPIHDRLYIKAAIEYSNVYAGRSDAQKSLSYLQEAADRAIRVKERSLGLLVEMHIAKYERLKLDFDKALRHFKEAFSQVALLNDPELTEAATMFHTYFSFWQGHFKDVMRIYERSVAEVDKFPIGRFPIIAAMMVGHCYSMTGQTTHGLAMLHAIRNYCVRGGDAYVSSHADASIAMVMLSINRYEDALRYAKLSLKEARDADNRWVFSLDVHLIALIYHLQNKNKNALRYLRMYRKNSVVAGANLLCTPYLLEICWAIELGKLPAVEGYSLELEIDRALASRSTFIEGLALRYKALLGGLRGSSRKEIGRLLISSSKHLKESGNQFEFAKTQLELTRHYLSLKDNERVKAAMQIASDILSRVNVELIPDDLRPLAANTNLEATVLKEILGLTNGMTPQKDNQRLLQQIVITANRLIGAERGALFVVNASSQASDMRLRVSKNMTIEEIDSPEFAPTRKFIADIISLGKGRILQFDQGENAASCCDETIRSSICVPIILEQKTIGALYHENLLFSSAFKPTHIHLLEYFATQAALYLAYEKAREEVARLNRKNDDEKLRAEIAETSEPANLTGIIGKSSVIKNVLLQVNRIAQKDTNVLIFGETGVGKNLVAEAIHKQSMRRNGPFVTVQCGTLTESLMTSELFGHEKGAFTGATERRIGRFELANKGTLFLDEIEDLSPEVQARLLRVLQSREFERVGGGKDTLISDFRLITATNQDLEDAVRAKRFRQDLYYRINVFPIEIPPLRERREDISLLAHYFLKQYASEQDGYAEDIPQEIIDALMRYDWPGNVRELQNVIQRGVALSSRLRFELPRGGIMSQRVMSASGMKTLEENEKEHILKALQITGWKIRGRKGTAEILGINPSTLRSRIRKLGILRPSVDT